MLIDNQKIEQIIHNRIKVVPKDIKRSFPIVIREKQQHWIAFNNENYFFLAFVSHERLREIISLKDRSLDPFPGLITTDAKTGAAIKVSNSRNVILKDNTVENSYSFSLGNDATLIIENHTQIIKTKEIGTYKFIVDLAFIVARGNEINDANQYEYLDGLISYAINKWRGKE